MRQQSSHFGHCSGQAKNILYTSLDLQDLRSSCINGCGGRSGYWLVATGPWLLAAGFCGASPHDSVAGRGLPLVNWPQNNIGINQ